MVGGVGKVQSPSLLDTPNFERQRLSTPVRIAIGTSAVIIFLAVILGIVYLCMQRRRNRASLSTVSSTMEEVGSKQKQEDEERLVGGRNESRQGDVVGEGGEWQQGFSFSTVPFGGRVSLDGKSGEEV